MGVLGIGMITEKPNLGGRGRFHPKRRRMRRTRRVGVRPCCILSEFRPYHQHRKPVRSPMNRTPNCLSGVLNPITGGSQPQRWTEICISGSYMPFNFPPCPDRHDAVGPAGARSNVLWSRPMWPSRDAGERTASPNVARYLGCVDQYSYAHRESLSVAAGQTQAAVRSWPGC